MRPSPRKRRLNSSVEILLLVGVTAAISLTLLLVGGSREQATTAQVTSPAPAASAAYPPPSPTFPPEPPRPTPGPDDPFLVSSCATRITDINFLAEKSTTIVIGTVKQVPPARWATPDGRRPPNPHARANKAFIYRPVLIQVEQYLKGEEQRPNLTVLAVGGKVGQDELSYCGDPINEFTEGERVVLFLEPFIPENRPALAQTEHGRGTFEIGERYTITNDQATNIRRTVPLQQLVTEIQTGSSPEASVTATSIIP